MPFQTKITPLWRLRVDDQWLILDNRTLTLVRDMDLMRATPELILDQEGVKRFVSRLEPGEGRPERPIVNLVVKRPRAWLTSLHGLTAGGLHSINARSANSRPTLELISFV